MTNLNLDARKVGQDVSCHSVVRADLGEGRSLVVISGIAVPAFTVNDDEHTNRQTCRLNLRERAELVEHSTVSTGLASISNGETAYVFATDHATLTRNSDGELVLEVALAAAGEDSGLHRFSYQVVVTNRVVAAEITGTISWPTAWFRPAGSDPGPIGAIFHVVANEQTFTSGGTAGPAGPGSGPFGPVSVEHLRPVRDGQVTSVSIADDVCRATYRIADPPKDVQLRVTVAQTGLQPTGGGTAELVPTPPNVDLLRLTVAAPTRAGVDFRATRPTVVA